MAISTLSLLPLAVLDHLYIQLLPLMMKRYFNVLMNIQIMVKCR